MNNLNRRTFLKWSTLAPLALAFVGQVGLLGQKAWANALKLVDMSKKTRKDADNEAAVGMLTGMGYVDDADKSEKAGKIKRTDKPHPGGGNMPAAKQYCNNCALFDVAGLDKNEPGKCALVATALVAAKGYCNTYSVNAKAKLA